jgi:hypothetical protein
MHLIIMHVGNTDVSVTGWFLVLSAIGLLGGIASS